MPSRRKEANDGMVEQPKLLEPQEVTQDFLGARGAGLSALPDEKTLSNVFVKFATAVVFRGKTEISLKLPTVSFHEATGRIGFYDPVMKGMVYVWPSNIQFLRYQVKDA